LPLVMRRQTATSPATGYLAARGQVNHVIAVHHRENRVSKMTCICGNVISDVVCPSPTEGWLTGDEDRERLQAESAGAVKSFRAALVAEQKEEWIRHFFGPNYPADLADESVLSDVLSSIESRYQKSVAECQQCGRLWIQVSPGENLYRSYSPDKGGYAGILRGAERGTS
jgi:hypothetical protein